VWIRSNELPNICPVALCANEHWYNYHSVNKVQERSHSKLKYEISWYWDWSMVLSVKSICYLGLSRITVTQPCNVFKQTSLFFIIIIIVHFILTLFYNRIQSSHDRTRAFHQTFSFVGQFSWLMCPHLVRLLKLKRLLQYISTNLGLQVQSLHKTEIRTHMMFSGWCCCPRCWITPPTLSQELSKELLLCWIFIFQVLLLMIFLAFFTLVCVCVCVCKVT